MNGKVSAAGTSAAEPRDWSGLSIDSIVIYFMGRLFPTLLCCFPSGLSDHWDELWWSSSPMVPAFHSWFVCSLWIRIHWELIDLLPVFTVKYFGNTVQYFVSRWRALLFEHIDNIAPRRMLNHFLGSNHFSTFVRVLIWFWINHFLTFICFKVSVWFSGFATGIGYKVNFSCRRLTKRNTGIDSTCS